jgi:hypothetical protein
LNNLREAFLVRGYFTAKKEGVNTILKPVKCTFYASVISMRYCAKFQRRNHRLVEMIVKVNQSILTHPFIYYKPSWHFVM